MQIRFSDKMESDVRPIAMTTEYGDDKSLLMNSEYLEPPPVRPVRGATAARGSLNLGFAGPPSAVPSTFVSFQVHCKRDHRDSSEGCRLELAASWLGFRHTLVAAVVVGMATILAVIFPNILSYVNHDSDAYCFLFFLSFSCWMVCALAVVVARLCCAAADLAVLRPPVPTKRILKLGMYYGVSGLAIFYGRDRYRVLCHLQDPLAAAILPAAVVCHLFVSAKVDGLRKLVCIAVAIIGLFICVDFQIWDEFSCHGRMITTSVEDGMSWTPDEHAIWAIVYVIGLSLLALFYTLLDRDIKGDKTEYLFTTIPMSPCKNETNVAVIDDPQTGPQGGGDPQAVLMSVPYVPRLPGVPPLSFARALVLCMWIQLAGWFTILVLFWTDLFSFLGKAGSATAFHEMMVNGLGCFFGGGCKASMAVVWVFVLAYSVLFVAVVYLIVIARNCSVAYVFTVLTLALPLSTLWWSFFEGETEIYWYPMFTGETGFTLVGFPIMVAALVLYRYYAGREKLSVIDA